MKYIFTFVFIILSTELYSQTHWEKTNWKGWFVETITINSNGNVFLGNYRGIYRSNDKGKIWSQMGSIRDVRVLYMLPNGDIFAGTAGKGIYLSKDNGTSWIEKNNGLQGTNQYIYSIAQRDSEIYIGSYTSIFKSSNNGENWTLCSNQLKTYISALVINTNGHIFAGTYSNGMFRSTNHGQTWTSINNGLPENIYSLAINSNGYLFAGAGTGVFRSVDNGETWVYLSEEWQKSGRSVSAMIINSNDYIYAGIFNNSIFQSTDDGKSWSHMRVGDPHVWAMAIDSSDFIYAGDWNLFRSVNSTTNIEDDNQTLLSEFFLSQNYPNPFNPTTNIQYTINSREFVIIKVYDILGKEVATLVNEEKPASNYEVKFDGSKLSSGVYFYQMQAGDFVGIKKFVLVK